MYPRTYVGHKDQAKSYQYARPQGIRHAQDSGFEDTGRDHEGRQTDGSKQNSYYYTDPPVGCFALGILHNAK
jgi:hypothetical protein